MSARQTRPTGKKPVNPPGFLATQDLKDRGWTAPLIKRFLGEHDATRENGLRMGRRKLPPVKLYEEARVLDVEREDAFLAAQAKAADARARAEQARAAREARRAALLEAAAASYVPVIHPEALRKGAVRKARDPYLPVLERVQQQLEQELGRVTARESGRLRELLRERLDTALSVTYGWYPAPGQRDEQARPAPASDAKPSDWREWDWD